MISNSDEAKSRLARELTLLRESVDADIGDLFRVLRDTADAVAQNTLRNTENGKPVTARSVSKYVLACKLFAQQQGRPANPPLFAPEYWRQLWAEGDLAPQFQHSTTGTDSERAEVAQAAQSSSPGKDLGEIIDPFDLEVHQPITVIAHSDRTPLPPYARRDHDKKLADVVARAEGGQSAMAVLVAGSSTGKTRALWEALTPLRQQQGWRLWHPREPTRQHALQEGISQIGPRTVVWLNETHRYFENGSPSEQERVATSLRALLTDPHRAPVLILCTLWREQYQALTDDPAAQTRILLDKSVIISVPSEFVGTDLDTVKEAATQDPRLKFAVEHALDGRITQYVAGGPELVDRYEHQVSVAARAVIEVAMDAVRMGHRNALPYMLLRDASVAYLTGTELDVLKNHNWFEEALAEASRSCKGAAGPVTQIRPHPFHTRRTTARSRRAVIPPGPTVQESLMFQLADYLDQYGREHRIHQIPPIGFWQAAALHSNVVDQHALGFAARIRGLHRDAAQLWKNASDQGNGQATLALVHHLRHIQIPADHLTALAANRIPINEGSGVGPVLRWLFEVGAHDDLAALANRVAAHLPLRLAHVLTLTLLDLHAVGALDQLAVLAHRVATQIPFDNVSSAIDAMNGLHMVGALDERAVLADRVANELAIDNALSVSQVLQALHQAGSHHNVAVLANRAANHVSIGNGVSAAVMLEELFKIAAHDSVTILRNRIDLSQVPVDDPFAVGLLMQSLHTVGAQDHAASLGNRVETNQIRLTDPAGAALLMLSMLRVNLVRQASVLAARANPAQVRLDDPSGAFLLTKVLHLMGLQERVALLTDRVAAETPIDDASVVAKLLEELEKVGAHDQLIILANRTAAQVPVDDTSSVAAVFDALKKVDAHNQIVRLLNRVDPTHVRIDTAHAVAQVILELHRVGAYGQAGVLAARAAVEVPLPTLGLTVVLLDVLSEMDSREPWEKLRRRLPAAGQYDLWVSDVPDHRFAFGREPDGTAAPAWDWDDLTWST